MECSKKPKKFLVLSFVKWKNDKVGLISLENKAFVVYVISSIFLRWFSSICGELDCNSYLTVWQMCKGFMLAFVFITMYKSFV